MDASTDSYKCRTALKYNIPVVSAAFIEACSDAGRLVEPDDFLVAGRTKKKDFQSGKIAGM